MEFASIGSGSKGNGTLIRYQDQLVLIDCGFSLQETRVRMQALGADISGLTAIVVTHEHGDHAKGVGAVARFSNAPVYLTHGTYRSCRHFGKINCQWITPEQPFRLGELTFYPVTVPHDATEPCQFVVETESGLKLGLITDVGHITPHIRSMYQDCQALLLECNHDTAMLAAGPYPYSLKKRVGGLYGHLSNDQSVALLAAINHSRLQVVCMTHLSEQNNQPELAQYAVSSVLGDHTQLCCVDQQQGLIWQKIESGI